MAKPIYDLLKYDSKCPPGKKQQPKEKCRPKKKAHQVPSSTPVPWSDEHQSALNFLIDCLTSPPVMAYPDYEIPFVLHTDASQEGLGAVLYQKQQGRMCVVGYALRTLTPAETKYHLHSGKLEFLALKWAITEHFWDYLFYASDFTVYTDNNPLTYVMTTAKLNSTRHRWLHHWLTFTLRSSTDWVVFTRMLIFCHECTLIFFNHGRMHKGNITS